MKNLTIAMDEETHRLTRLEAANQGVSMSRFVSDLLRDRISKRDVADDETRRRLDALQRVFDAPKLSISVNGRMPTAEERNARR